MIELLSICLVAYRGLFQMSEYTITVLAIVFVLVIIEILNFVKGV